MAFAGPTPPTSATPTPTAPSSASPTPPSAAGWTSPTAALPTPAAGTPAWTRLRTRHYAGLDRFGRVIDQKWQNACGTPVFDEYTYAYDSAGNRTSRSNAQCSTLSETYAYDGLNRLIATDRGGDDYQQWGLDQLGNWGTFATDTNDDGVIDESDTPQTRTHDAANQITTIDQCSAGLSYDAAGNMTGDGTLTYKYDAWPIRVPGPRENRLTEADLGESVVAVYTYDGVNRRVSKAVAVRDACGTLTGYDRTDYHYDEAWTSASSARQGRGPSLSRAVEPQVLEERFAGNQCSADTVAAAPHAQYVWDIRYIDAPVLRLRDTAGPSCGQPDGDLGDAGDEVLYYTNDANMNVTALVNTSGEVVERYAYDAYGKPIVLNGEEGADPDTDSQANPAVLEWSADPDGKSDVGNEILNSGYRYNYETGNSQVRNREYLTVLGRWAQPDPEGYVDGMNRASYCQDAPTTTLDPLGLKNKNFLKCASSTWRNGARVDLMWHEDIYACGIIYDTYDHSEDSVSILGVGQYFFYKGQKLIRTGDGTFYRLEDVEGVLEKLGETRVTVKMLRFAPRMLTAVEGPQESFRQFMDRFCEPDWGNLKNADWHIRDMMTLEAYGAAYAENNFRPPDITARDIEFLLRAYNEKWTLQFIAKLAQGVPVVEACASYDRSATLLIQQLASVDGSGVRPTTIQEAIAVLPRELLLRSAPILGAGGAPAVSPDDPEFMKGWWWGAASAAGFGVFARRTLTGGEVKAGMEIAPTEVSIFRGGASLEVRSIDVKIVDGMVQPTHGLSLGLDAASLQKFGGAYRIKSIPGELKIIQRGGNMGHFEIVPRVPMTLERFQELLKSVATEAHGR